MTEKIDALAAQVDAKVREYVEEAIRLAALENAELISKQSSNCSVQDTVITDLTTRISELEGEVRASSEGDKYALTKAKLVQFMKKQGWFD